VGGGKGGEEKDTGIKGPGRVESRSLTMNARPYEGGTDANCIVLKGPGTENRENTATVVQERWWGGQEPSESICSSSGD